MSVYCNARKRGNKDELPKREPAEEHAGDGYCAQQRESGRCEYHGGESVPPGPEHHRYKNGRHSKYVPDDLKNKFAEALDDEEYMSLMSEIALVDTRIDEVLDGLDTGTTPQDLEDIEDAYEGVRAAHSSDNDEDLGDALDDLEEALAARNDRADSWSELGELFELRRELVSEERRQAEFLAQVVHRDQFITVMDQLADSVKRSLEKHVEDDDARDEVLRDVTREIQETFQ